MSEPNLHSGWNSIEEGAEEVPVRYEQNGSNEPRRTHVVVGGPGHDIRQHATAEKASPKLENANPMLMRLSALTGIAIVSVGAALYFGLFSVRGNILDGSVATRIVITKEGRFSPIGVTIPRGSTLSILNDNANPQVLKPKESRELFPVQVLFQAPYSFVIPADAAGTYTYISETLPESEILTITISNTQGSGHPVPAKPPANREEIPLPFGMLIPANEEEDPIKENPVKEKEIEKIVREPGGSGGSGGSRESAVVSLGNPEQKKQTPIFTSPNIPTNPYTVEEGKKKAPQASIATTKAREEKLHSGAPQEALRKRPPTPMTETGPRGVLVVVGMSLGMLTLVHRRKMRTSGI